MHMSHAAASIAVLLAVLSPNNGAVAQGTIVTHGPAAAASNERARVIHSRPRRALHQFNLHGFGSGGGDGGGGAFGGGDGGDRGDGGGRGDSRGGSDGFGNPGKGAAKAAPPSKPAKLEEARAGNQHVQQGFSGFPQQLQQQQQQGGNRYGERWWWQRRKKRRRRQT